MSLRIEVAKTEEMNEFASENMARDGGWYSQPRIYFFVMNEDFIAWTGELQDTSCGDFGTRIRLSMNSRDGKKLNAYWGSMLDDSSAGSDFDRNDEEVNEIVFLIEKELGYSVPDKF